MWKILEICRICRICSICKICKKKRPNQCRKSCPGFASSPRGKSGQYSIVLLVLRINVCDPAASRVLNGAWHLFISLALYSLALIDGMLHTSLKSTASSRRIWNPALSVWATSGVGRPFPLRLYKEVHRGTRLCTAFYLVVLSQSRGTGLSGTSLYCPVPWCIE